MNNVWVVINHLGQIVGVYRDLHKAQAAMDDEGPYCRISHEPVL